MPILRQSTAQVIRFGPCLDITDGVTEETALTLAQADMRLSKDGGAFAQKSAAGNATHDSDGWYSTTLSTTDTATVGELRLNVHQPANMLPLWDRWWVIEEAIYDAIYGAAATGFDANGRVDVSEWAGVAVNALVSGRVDASTGAMAANVLTATAINADAITNAKIATDAIGSDELATTAVNEIRDAILSDSTAFAGANIATILTDTGTTLDDHLTDIKGTGFAKDTHSLTDITADVTGLAGAAMRGTDSAALASVCTEVRLAELAAANLPADVDAILADTGTTLDAHLTDIKGTAFAKDTHSLTDVTADVTGLAGATMRGTDSAALASVCTEARLAELAAANLPADVDSILADTGTTLDNHLTDIKGTAFVKDTHSLIDITVDVTGLAGAAMRGTDSAALASVCTEVRLAELAAANLPTDIDAILVDTASLNDTKIPDTISLANINAEVVDTLNVDTYAEPGQVVRPATNSIVGKIGYVHKDSRNRMTSTSTQIKLYNDDGTTVDEKWTQADDATTYDRSEVVVGP